VGLTQVEEDSHLFEASTNKHFNEQMNKQVQLDLFVNSDLKASRKNTTGKVLDAIRASLGGNMGSHQGSDNRYNRSNRHDYSRKNNGFAPILTDDSYTNFRFSKRATEMLSPLSRSRFGITSHKPL